MLNFTVGPVQMDQETRCIGSEQVPYFRTLEFSSLMKENEILLCNLFDAPEGARAVFMTGSGTAGMEASIMNFYNKRDKVLVVNGGSFGQRLVELCEIHEVPHTEIKLEYGQPLTADILNQYAGKGYTGMLLQLCETSTGILYDMNMVGSFCRQNGLLLMVDAISGFLADEFSMKDMNVNVALTGSQKALSLPPGMSFVVADTKALDCCLANKPRSLYFDFKDYLKNGERGQTPFTPAVSVLIQLNEKLKRIADGGGAKAANRQISDLARYFRKCVETLPFKMFIDERDASNCVTSLSPVHEGISAYTIFETLKNEFGIWICPNGGTLKDKVFRVGHIGNITKQEVDILIKSFDILLKRGEL